MERNKIIVKTSIYGIIVNLILVAFKAVVGLASASIAIILDAVNNLTDALSSIITIAGTKLANRPPDKKHPYGYGRVEYFTSVVIAAIILFAGITAAKESIEKIIHPEDSAYTAVGLTIIAVAVAVKLIFGRYVKRVGDRVNSNSLSASGQDALMDALLSFTTLAGGVATLVWGVHLEGWLGAVIAVFIIKTALEILMTAANSMLGERADPQLAAKLRAEVQKFDQVQGVFDLNLHNYGPTNTVASFHIQVPNRMTAEEIHILTREIAYKVFAKFGIACTIGIYAANNQGQYGKIQDAIAKIIEDYPEVLQVHGFYVDRAKANVFFDLIVDFAAPDREKVKAQVVRRIKKLYPQYHYNVILDSDITD